MYRELPHLTGPGIRAIRVILWAVFAYHNQPRKYMTLFMGILIEVLWSCYDRLREQAVNVQQPDNVRRLRIVVGWTSSWSLALRERHEPVLR